MAEGAPGSAPGLSSGAPSERPLSPHLQIWRFTVTMAASITHRGTGVVLYGGFFLLALWLLGLGLSRPLYDFLAALFDSPLGLVIIAGFVWSLVFHLLNGMRHLYWDAGRGLAPSTARMTAWAIYAGATLFTIVILWAALGRGGA